MRRITLNAAIAVDYTQSNWMAGVQLFGRQILNEPVVDTALGTTPNFASLRIATDYINEKLKPEILLLVDLDDGGLLARPKASYEFSDNLIGTAGVDVISGSFPTSFLPMIEFTVKSSGASDYMSVFQPEP